MAAHGPKHADKMKEAGQSDEADTSRTQASQIAACTLFK